MPSLSKLIALYITIAFMLTCLNSNIDWQRIKHRIFYFDSYIWFLNKIKYLLRLLAQIVAFRSVVWALDPNCDLYHGAAGGGGWEMPLLHLNFKVPTVARRVAFETLRLLAALWDLQRQRHARNWTQIRICLLIKIIN